MLTGIALSGPVLNVIICCVGFEVMLHLKICLQIVMLDKGILIFI